MLSAQPQRPMHQLSMDEMRHVFSLVHGFLPDLDQCFYQVQENHNLLKTGQLIVVLEWDEQLKIVAGDLMGKSYAKRISVSVEQECAVIKYLIFDCQMSFSSRVPESWLQKALTAA